MTADALRTEKDTDDRARTNAGNENDPEHQHCRHLRQNALAKPSFLTGHGVR